MSKEMWESCVKSLICMRTCRNTRSPKDTSFSDVLFQLVGWFVMIFIYFHRIPDRPRNILPDIAGGSLLGRLAQTHVRDHVLWPDSRQSIWSIESFPLWNGWAYQNNPMLWRVLTMTHLVSVQSMFSHQTPDLTWEWTWHSTSPVFVGAGCMIKEIGHYRTIEASPVISDAPYDNVWLNLSKQLR